MSNKQRVAPPEASDDTRTSDAKRAWSRPQLQSWSITEMTMGATVGPQEGPVTPSPTGTS